MKLNCDAGESFGSWKMGLDEAVLPYVDMANFSEDFFKIFKTSSNQELTRAQIEFMIDLADKSISDEGLMILHAGAEKHFKNSSLGIKSGPRLTALLSRKDLSQNIDQNSAHPSAPKSKM